MPTPIESTEHVQVVCRHSYHMVIEGKREWSPSGVFLALSRKVHLLRLDRTSQS